MPRPAKKAKPTGTPLTPQKSASAKVIIENQIEFESHENSPLDRLPETVRVKILPSKFSSSVHAEVTKHQRLRITPARQRRGDIRSPFVVLMPADIREYIEKHLSSEDEKISLKSTSKYWASQSYSINDQPFLNLRNIEDVIKYYILLSRPESIALNEESIADLAEPKAVIIDQKIEATARVMSRKARFEFERKAMDLSKESKQRLYSIISNEDYIENDTLSEDEIEDGYYELVEEALKSITERTKRVRYFIDKEDESGIISKAYIVFQKTLGQNPTIRRFNDQYMIKDLVLGRTVEEIVGNLESGEAKFSDAATLIYTT